MKNFYKNQDGVTLLLSILILSSILAISFSLATILLIEVRSSGDLVRTEPSYYASQGITEEVIFKIKRRTNVPVAAVPAGPLGTVTVSAPTEHTTSTPVQMVEIEPGGTFETTNARIYFFDAANINSAGRPIANCNIAYCKTFW